MKHKNFVSRDCKHPKVIFIIKNVCVYKLCTPVTFVVVVHKHTVGNEMCYLSISLGAKAQLKKITKRKATDIRVGYGSEL